MKKLKFYYYLSIYLAIFLSITLSSLLKYYLNNGSNYVDHLYYIYQSSDHELRNEYQDIYLFFINLKMIVEFFIPAFFFYFVLLIAKNYKTKKYNAYPNLLNHYYINNNIKTLTIYILMILLILFVFLNHNREANLTVPILFYLFISYKLNNALNHDVINKMDIIEEDDIEGDVLPYTDTKQKLKILKRLNHFFGLIALLFILIISYTLIQYLPSTKLPDKIIVNEHTSFDQSSGGCYTTSHIICIQPNDNFLTHYQLTKIEIQIDFPDVTNQLEKQPHQLKLIYNGGEDYLFTIRPVKDENTYHYTMDLNDYTLSPIKQPLSDSYFRHFDYFIELSFITNESGEKIGLDYNKLSYQITLTKCKE